MSNLDLEYQVRAEQYRDMYRLAERERYLVRAGIVTRRWAGAKRLWLDALAAVTEAACRLRLVQAAPYCRAPSAS